MIRELDRELINLDKKIENLVAVTGMDDGTIRNRLRSSAMRDKAVVKTGTTNPVSALAGMMNTQSGRRYFGIFNHRQMSGGRISASKLRLVQNEVALKLMSDFGGGRNFGYQLQYLRMLENNLWID